ncbi:MAG: hypothetical protein ACD_40C00083G0004, partial [uncultured bacterium]
MKYLLIGVNMKKQAKIDPKVAQLESALARALADYANLERRFGVESSAVIKFANSNLLTNLLDIRDHLAMASIQIKEQSLSMILSSLDKILVEEGVTEVKTDGPFDPLTMECQEQGEGTKDQIIKVIRHGYRLHERVLRPARVIVGSGLSAQAGA